MQYAQDAEQDANALAGDANSTAGRAVIAGVEGEMGMNSAESGAISAALESEQGGGLVKDGEAFAESAGGEALVKDFL
ncbi:hypothetical protein P7C70_g4427, partial [Phenoliferia sp. Uapishka_3]